MKTNEEGTGKKDWQKVEARVLGQILAAQNVDFVLPDISHIAEFFAETLNTIPGITSCRVCLGDVSVQRGRWDSKICEECQASRKRSARQDEISSFSPGLDFTCGLGDQPGMHLNVVASLHHHFGYFIFQVSDPDVFNVYIPFIGNLANYVALSLESRLQRGLMQEAQATLERKVKERTRELETANVQLQEEIETKRQGEEALQREQTLLSRIMEASPVGITLVDREGQITFANSQAEKVLGLTRDEITQRTYNAPEWHITTYDGAPFPDEDLPFQQVMSTRQPVHDIQHMIAWPDGRRLALSINGVPILNATGDVDSVVFTIENITERIHTESALRESEQKFRSFVEESSDGFTLSDEQGYIIEWNRARERMTGLKADQVIGRFIWDVMHQLMPLERQTPETYERNKEVILNALENGQSPIFNRVLDAEVMTQDGERQFHQQTVFPIKTDKGYRIGSITRDITKRKQIEEELRASEEQLQLALDAAKMGQWEWNIITGGVMWSQQCLALYGLPPDTPMSYERFLQALHLEDREHVDAALNRAVEERSSYDEVKRTVWSDGTIHWTASRGQVYCDAAGEPIRMVGVTFDVSKWKEAEAQLLASEQLFRALVENSPDFIARYDREFRRIYVNPAIQSLFTGSKESVLDKTPVDQSPIYAPQVYIEHLRQAIETATENVGEMPFRTAQGEMHWGQIRFVPELNSDGKVATVLAIGRDIHEIKEDEQRFRMLAKNFPDFVIRFDHDNRCTYVNPAVEKAFGVSAESIIGKTLQELPHFGASEQNDALLVLIQHAFDEGISNETEAHWDTETGERIFEVRHVPEKDATGNVVSVLSIARDVTELKQAEEELRASETRFRIFVDHAADAFFLHDERGNILDVNQQACKSLGYSREELIGMSPLDFDAGADRDRPITDQVESRLDIGETVAFETLHRRKDGSLFPVDVRARPFWQGERRFSVSLARDISERKQAEQALRESEERLRQIASSLREVIWLRDAQTRQVLYVNPAFEELTGRTCKSFYENRDIVIDAIHPDDKEGVIEALEQRYEGVPYDKEHRIVRLDGNVRWVSSRIFPVRNEAGEVYRWASIMEDITERKQMGDALAAREREFRTLAENSPDNIARYDLNCRTIYVNPALEKTLGRPASEILGTPPMEMKEADIYEARKYQEKIAEVFKTGKDYEMDIVLPDKGEGVRYHNIRFVAERGADGAITGVQTIGRDITERKQAEIERQSHLQFLESMDQINRAIQGTNDLEQMMSDVLDIVLSIFNCDRAFLMYPLDPDASSWYSPMERTRPEYPGVLAQKIDEVPMDEDVARTFRILLDADGPVKFGLGTSNALPVDVSERFDIKSFMSMALYPKRGKPWQFGIHQCSYERIWTQEDERLLQEIGRRLSDALSSLLTYRTLQESEERYRQLVDVSPDAIVVYSQGRIAFVNPAAVRLAGAKSTEDLVGRSVLEFIQPDYGENVNKAIEHILRTGESGLFVRENVLRVDGTKFDVEVAIVPYQFQGENHIQILARDITERKQYERERDVIITVSTALRQAKTRIEIINVLLDQLVDLFDANGAVLVLPDPKTKGCINEVGHGAVGERMTGLSIPSGEGVGNSVITNKEPYLNNRADQDPLFYRPDLLGDSHCLIAAPLIAQEQAIGALLIARKINFVEQDLRLLTAIADIAANAIHRVTLHEQTEQQLHRLIALHQIDLAISTNIDLNITLNVILGSVKEELVVDAVCILWLNPITHTLDYTAGIGFRTRNIEQSHVRLGSGCAGRAAQELRTISGLDIGEGSGIFVRSSLLASEGFMLHYATPLLVKGQIKGVLEVFHRNPLEPEHTWFSYFETLATQAAIAIENTSLFENLQRSNTELTLAYDATIEGWSRALDLRDRETEGHTQRVAEMALELAEKMGMDDAEKVDLRRGALLHDIGKMGVPDAILLKPGPLSDDEWKIMRQHPLYAYQMLAPIKYLKRALEIPYCHHEKWDGSGYPRGLKGEEIPLSARVFSVVDVFDALTSDRPYSSAWQHPEAYRYLHEQAGKYFDPQVVKLFLESR